MTDTSFVSVDFECFSEADLKKVGAWAYSAHKTTELICMSYAIDDGPLVLLTDKKEIVEKIKFFLSQDNTVIRAWNSFFEMAICANTLSIKEALDPAKWSDTAAMAAALSMPRALGSYDFDLGIAQSEQKTKRGRYLIQRLCKLYKGSRNQDPELLQELYDYCKQDVVAERTIYKKLRPLNNMERKVWELDQTINIRGVFIDMKAVDDALVIIDKVTEQLNDEVSTITKGQLTNVSQRQKVIDYIAELGYSLEKFDKAYLESVLKDESLPATARRLIEIRQQLGKTSIAKYKALKQLVTEDSRAHGVLMYHGAATGRWSGKHFQPQNLPRPSFTDTEACIELFKSKDNELLEMIYDDPMEALSSCLRGMICAPEGKRLIVSDYSAIEARVLAWLAGQDDVVNVFRSHGKIYEHTASQIYGVELKEVDKEQRFIGKVATLALGYQGGAKAFQGMAEMYGVDIDTDLAETVKSDWRSANNKITRFWWDIDTAAKNATKHPIKTFQVRSIKFRCMSNYLFCRLPSGRALSYYQPRIAIGRFDNEQFTFMGTNSVTRKWQRQETYGGKLVENITQAVARDLMAEAMLRIEDAGYEVVLSIHDEVIAEARNGFGSVEEFENLMCQLPSWAEGLPINSEGFECQRYRK